METCRWILAAFILFQLIPYSLAGIYGRNGMISTENSLTPDISSPSTQNAPIRSRPKGGAVQVQFGMAQRFCSMFGCDCTPPNGAMCCDGYTYDRHSRKCRQMM
ncbi:unnamed protein product [Larinioides sclopetarius]|uniref:Uncharacterized protein n=1 Tax=Larinioides sclopetarius TaxID=280406 RepID=A0AAV2B6J2_9ARAC